MGGWPGRGLLLSRFWWGSVFLINVPIVTVGLAGVIWFVPESRNPHPGKLDVSGVLLSIAGLVSLSYGVIQGGDTGQWASLGALTPLTAGLALLALFTWRESRIKNPVLNVRLFRDTRLCCAVAASATESIGETMAVAQHLGAAGTQLATPAHAAFISAMHVAVAVAVAVFGAVVVLA